MDLLFEKMADPFRLLDQLILNGDLLEWTLEFIDDQNDRQLWDVWLHKVFDKSFEDFKKTIMGSEPNEEQLETTISESKSIINGFIPD